MWRNNCQEYSLTIFTFDLSAFMLSAMNYNKTFIIAEAGVNHNGSLAMAFKLIDVAVAVGADAVKFQAFKAEKVIAVNGQI